MSKITIRGNCFETNSSSMHSIVINNKDFYETKTQIKSQFERCIKDGKYYIYDIEFGRSPFRCLYKFKDKFNYCFGAFSKEYRDGAWNTMEIILSKYLDEKIIVETELELNYVCRLEYYEENEETKPKYHKPMDEETFVKYLETLEEKYNMKIDYSISKQGDKYLFYLPSMVYTEDYGKTKEFIDERNITIEEFLVNERYVILCDGDERLVTDDLLNSGLMKESAIEVIR